MIVVPKEQPLIGNLNSYFVKVPKLVEHFQGEIGCGAVHFKSASAEGILYFDKDQILNGVFRDRGEETAGASAAANLMAAAGASNFALSVYGIQAEEIDFWSTIPDAKLIYQDLSTEFTDLEGLIKKMKSEELTGFIEVLIDGGAEGGLLFFNNGKIIGGSYSWHQGTTSRQAADQEELVRHSKAKGGVFHVSRMPVAGSVKVPVSETAAAEPPAKPSGRILTAIEELLVLFERVVNNRKGREADFTTLLSRKFVEKADQYPFLDPFAAEFRFVEGAVTFSGDTDDGSLLRGVVESLRELGNDLGMLAEIRDHVSAWSKKYAKELGTLDVQL
jgi:hypothetical protein